MENLSESESEINPADIGETANIVTLDLLPTTSRARYENVYQAFEEWYEQHQIRVITEEVILAYFNEKSESLKSSSLWSLYSMLKTTLNMKKNIDLKQYSKVLAFLKKKSVGYKAKKSQVFSREQCDTFLKEADDKEFLLYKVVLIIGLAGACRCDELYKMTVDCIENNGNNLVINLPDSKTRVQRTFVVVGSYNMALYRKYTALRPAHVQHRRFFLYYTSGRCTAQPIGIKTFSKIPRSIAKFLKLSNVELYTGHCLRKSSTTLLMDGGSNIINLQRHGGWKSDAAHEEFDGSASNTRREGLRESNRKANSSRQGSDKEESSLMLASLLQSKRDEEPEEISESGAEVLSSGFDPLDAELTQFSKTTCFSPSSSAEVYNTGVPSSSDNWLRRNETEMETSPLSNQPILSGVVNDACTKFFLSMADTVRDLPPDLQIVAKRNVLHEVTECELTALNRLNMPKN